jgi:hypothetical protein
MPPLWNGNLNLREIGPTQTPPQQSEVVLRLNRQPQEVIFLTNEKSLQVFKKERKKVRVRGTWFE